MTIGFQEETADHTCDAKGMGSSSSNNIKRDVCRIERQLMLTTPKRVSANVYETPACSHLEYLLSIYIEY